MVFYAHGLVLKKLVSSPFATGGSTTNVSNRFFLFMSVSRIALCKGSTGFWLKGVFPVDGRLCFLGLDPTGGKHSCVGVHKQHLDFMCQLVPKIRF